MYRQNFANGWHGVDFRAVAALLVVVLLIVPTAVAIASAVAVLAAESADAFVCRWLRGQGRVLAAIVINIGSSLIESTVFLAIAFGIHPAVHGAWALTVGKFEASLVALAALAGLAAVAQSRRRRNAA
jgi:chromate transport protein ChrA